MTNILKKIFLTDKPVIGMIHLKPLIGYKDFISLEEVLNSALQDAFNLEKGGVDGIMIENNYDYPHKVKVGAETITAMTVISQRIKEKIKTPLGICVLWNDYKASLAIAKIVGAQFIRIPVFVDDVETQYGVIYCNPKDVINYRKKIKAENVAIFTDVHVKHSKMISKHSLIKSARLAIKNRSDALILTGKWTGDLPELEKIKRVRKIVANFPILVGSGATVQNITSLLRYVDGIIVGTSFKIGKSQAKQKEVNIKNYQQRISFRRTRDFMDVFKKLLK